MTEAMILLRYTPARQIVDEVLCWDQRNGTVQAILLTSDGTCYGQECRVGDIEAESDGECLCPMDAIRELAQTIIDRRGERVK